MLRNTRWRGWSPPYSIHSSPLRQDFCLPGPRCRSSTQFCAIWAIFQCVLPLFYSSRGYTNCNHLNQNAAPEKCITNNYLSCSYPGQWNHLLTQRAASDSLSTLLRTKFKSYFRRGEEIVALCHAARPHLNYGKIYFPQYSPHPEKQVPLGIAGNSAQRYGQFPTWPQPRNCTLV